MKLQRGPEAHSSQLARGKVPVVHPGGLALLRILRAVSHLCVELPWLPSCSSPGLTHHLPSRAHMEVAGWRLINFVSHEGNIC